MCRGQKVSHCLLGTIVRYCRKASAIKYDHVNWCKKIVIIGLQHCTEGLQTCKNHISTAHNQHTKMWQDSIIMVNVLAKHQPCKKMSFGFVRLCLQSTVDYHFVDRCAVRVFIFLLTSRYINYLQMEQKHGGHGYHHIYQYTILRLS